MALMTKLLKTPYFAFNNREITTDVFSEHISSDNVFSRRIAEPLFDADLIVAGVTERTGYDSGMPGKGKRTYHSFTLLLQGSMEITLGDRQKTIEPGELVWSPSGTRFRRTGNGSTWWLYFDLRDTGRWLPLREAGPYIRPYEDAALMFLHLRTILDARYKSSPDVPTLALDSARFLVSLLMREMSAIGSGLSPHGRALERLMGEIARRPHMPWTLAEMAERTAISKSHLSALFKEQFGLSPMEAVIKQRMQKAIDLLVHEKRTVQAAASAVGYQSTCSFTRLFTRHIGMSPQRYRKAHPFARALPRHSKD